MAAFNAVLPTIWLLSKLPICTDLGSLIGKTQCGNFRNFLPLRFYVKSNLVMLKPKKLPFWPFDQLWILNNFDIFKCEIFLKIEIESLQNCWNGRFSLSETSQNWFQVKLEVAGKLLDFHCQNSQLGCSCL